MSGSVARNMSGLGRRYGNTPKPGTLVTGDPVSYTHLTLPTNREV